MDTIEKVDFMYAAFRAGEIEKIIDSLSDDVIWHTQAGSPFAGTYQGKERVREFFQHVAHYMRWLVFDTHIRFANHDGSVATVFVKAAGSVSTTGKPVEQEIVHRLHFTPDGKLCAVHEWVSDSRTFAAAFEP